MTQQTLIPTLICSALVALVLGTAPTNAVANGYTTTGSCGIYDRISIASPKGTCVALVADRKQGLQEQPIPCPELSGPTPRASVLRAVLGGPIAVTQLVALHGYRKGGHRVVALTLDSKGLPKGPPRDVLWDWDAKAGVRPMGKPTGLALAHNGQLWVAEDHNHSILRVLPE
jgi:hypothetical protein